MIKIRLAQRLASVMGQQPTMLPSIENTNIEQDDDARQGSNLGSNRGAIRLRELALDAVQQATAYSRSMRAAKSDMKEVSLEEFFVPKQNNGVSLEATRHPRHRNSQKNPNIRNASPHPS